eukprot:2056517-Prymnesium_polylepis.1
MTIRGDELQPSPADRVVAIQRSFEPHVTLLFVTHPARSLAALEKHVVTLASGKHAGARAVSLLAASRQPGGPPAHTIDVQCTDKLEDDHPGYGWLCGTPAGKLRALEAVWTAAADNGATPLRAASGLRRASGNTTRIDEVVRSDDMCGTDRAKLIRRLRDRGIALSAASFAVREPPGALATRARAFVAKLSPPLPLSSGGARPSSTRSGGSFEYRCAAGAKEEPLSQDVLDRTRALVPAMLAFWERRERGRSL